MNPNLLRFWVASLIGTIGTKDYRRLYGFNTEINYIDHEEDDEDIAAVKEFMKQVHKNLVYL